MKYISKGMVIKASTEELLFVTRHGTDFQLTDLQAELWLNGRYGFAESGGNILERKALQQLNRQGLVELVESDEPAAEYRALTQCVLVPAQPQGHRVLLSTREKELLRWLTDAGLHLTTAELVFLAEHRVMPTADLLGERNRQRLTERIYTQETIFDNILEAQMEHAAARDEVVDALLRLLEKQGITEKLKRQDNMEWTRRMNAICHDAEEMILTEMIYTKG